jgi:hypothetical protein
MNVSGGLYGRSLWDGVLSGTVYALAVPLRREVVVFLEEFATADYPGARYFSGWDRLGSVFSNPTTGAWEIRHLDPSRTYSAAAWDSSGEYDPVVKSGLIPE